MSTGGTPVVPVVNGRDARPFFEAGVLREKAQKLNIKWGKDRGKDVTSAPWYAVFHGDRTNDYARREGGGKGGKVKRGENDDHPRWVGVKYANARFTPKNGTVKTGVKSANACFTSIFD